MRNTPTEEPGTLKTLQDVPRAIKKGDVSSLYVLYGSDRYLLDRLQNDVIDALLPDKGAMREFNLDALDGSVVQLDELTTLVETMPMGSTRRVVLLRNPAFLSAAAEPSAIKRLAQAQAAYESGNQPRALSLCFRALDLEPMPLSSPEVAAKIEALRNDVAEQNAELLPFLDDLRLLFAETPIPETVSVGSDRDRFYEWLGKGLPDTSVLALRLDENPGKRILNRLDQVGALANVDTLKSQARRGKDSVTLFIEGRLRREGREIDADALRMLRERTKDDLQAVSDELEKLLAYVGERTRIAASDVAATVSDRASGAVFDLTDAIGARNLRGALESLHGVLMQGEPPLKVHAMFARQARLMKQALLLQNEGHLTSFSRNMPYRAFMNLVYRKWPDELTQRLPDEASLNLLKQKPYAMYQIMKQAARFTLPEVDRAYRLLVEADEALKSNLGSEASILQTAAIEMTRRQEPTIGGA